MTMRAFFFLLGLVAFGHQASADYFVRPVEACANNGNGQAYGCAASGGATGAWRGMTGVSQSTPASNDIVRLCGRFATSSADTASVMLTMNWSNASVILDGDCSEYGDLAKAILDGEGVHDRGLDSGSGGTVTPTIRNISIRGFDVHGIIGQNTASDGWNITNVDCDGSYATGTCFRNLSAGATGWVVDGGRLVNCNVDCIYSVNPMTVRNVVGREWSLDGATGDFIQATTDCDGWVLENLDLESSTDIKQAVIIQSCSGALNATINGGRFVKRGQSTDTTLGIVPLFFDASSGTATVQRVFVSGGRKNIFAANGVSLVLRSSMLGPSTTQNVHCGTSTVACTIQNNDIVGGTVGIEMQAAGAGGLAQNNAIRGAAIGINRGASGVENFNDIYAATDRCYVGGVAGACAVSDLNAEPGWVGGNSPTTAEGFKMATGSPLRVAGTGLSSTVNDYAGTRFEMPRPSIGAYSVANSPFARQAFPGTRSARP